MRSNVFLQDHTNGIGEAVQNIDQQQLVLVAAAHHVKEDINILLVDARQPVQHNYVRV